MTNAEQVESFVKTLFEMYNMSYQRYFTALDDDYQGYEESMIVDGDTLDMDLVQRAAMLLGVDVDDLLSCNEAVAERRYNEYAYFELLDEFLCACAGSYYDEKDENARLMSVLFGKTYKGNMPAWKYNEQSIVQRMFDSLREIDQYLPGAYHEGARVTHLTITTEQFCHFPQVGELFDAFTEMVKQAKRLFMKAFDNELTAQEIKDYNFLVAVLGLKDRISQKEVFYSKLQELIPAYQNEGWDNFYEMVKVDRHRIPEFWHAAEFVENKDRVQQLEYLYPGVKSILREYAMKTSQFFCEFKWSDAEHVHFSPEEEADQADFEDMMGIKPIPYEERALESTSLYVKKTPQENGNNERFSRLLNIYAGPVSTGGILPVQYKADALSLQEKLDIMCKRVNMRGPMNGGLQG